MEKVFSSKNRLLGQFFFIFLFFLCITAHADEIVKISDPKELASFLEETVTKDTLLVLDIDDTLIVAHKPILRANHLDHLLNELRNRLALSQDEALGLIEYSLESTNQRLGKGQLLLQEWRSMIEKCYARMSKIIALTNVSSGKKTIDIPKLGIQYTQRITGEDRRLEDLEAVGLNFERSFQKELKFDSKILTRYPFSDSFRTPPVFKKGVICTNLHSKGEALVAFLLEIPWKPTKVVFVDNISGHLTSVEKKMRDLGIPFRGVHFTYVETNLCELEPFVFESQINSFISQKLNEDIEEAD